MLTHWPTPTSTHAPLMCAGIPLKIVEFIFILAIQSSFPIHLFEGYMAHPHGGPSIHGPKPLDSRPPAW